MLGITKAGEGSFGVLLAAEEPRIHIPPVDELIWGGLAFLIVLFLLVKFVFPKAGEMLDQRTARVRSELESAEQAKLEAQKMLEEYRASLANARTEAQGIIDEAKRSAESIKRDLEARAQQEAQGIVERARAEVAGERDRALQELRSTIGDLSLQLASRVVERELTNQEAHKAMVDQMIRELSAAGNGPAS